MFKQASQRWIVFAVTSLFFLLSQFYRASMAVISPDLISDLDLNTSQLSLLSSVFFYAFALMQIPLGLALDRIGPKRTMIWLSAVGVCGSLCFAWSADLKIALLGRILLGIGMACNLMGPFKLLTIWFGPAGFASLITLMFSIGHLGNIIASSPLVLMVEMVGWRWALTVIAFFHILLACIFCWIVQDKPEKAGYTVDSHPSFKTVLTGLAGLLRSKDYWIISIGTFCRYGVYAAIQTLWVGPYLIHCMGYSSLTAGNVILMLNIGFIAAGPLWGLLSDRIVKSRKVVILAGLMGMIIVLAALSFQSRESPLWVFCLLFTLFGIAGSAGGIMYSHIKERMPSPLAGTAMTGINLFTIFGAAFFLQSLGHMMKAVYPDSALGLEAFRLIFFLCCGSLILVAALYMFTQEEHHEL